MADEVKVDDGSIDVVDSNGRTLKVKEPTFLQEARITRLCGDASTNVGYMYAYVFPVTRVVAIDGVPVPFPTTELQLDGLITRVGREGCEAVIKHLSPTKNLESHEVGVKN